MPVNVLCGWMLIARDVLLWVGSRALDVRFKEFTARNQFGQEAPGFVQANVICLGFREKDCLWDCSLAWNKSQ